MTAFAANSLLCRGALAAGSADASSFTTIRLASGALALGLLSRSRQEAAPRRSWRPSLALFAYALGFSLAYRRIPAGTGALLLFAAVQLTMIGAGLRGGERPRALEWTGLVASVVGLAVLTGRGLGRPEPLGALLMVTAGVAWGLYSLWGRHADDPLLANASSFGRASVLALGASLVVTPLGVPKVSAAGALLAAASGALASGLGYAVWYAALRGLSATRAAIVQLSVPPLAAMGGVALLGEVFTARLALASLLILGGIALASLARSAPLPRPDPPPGGEMAPPKRPVVR
jgi:drug/metabolite transporter (DMT)-like permease